MTASGPARPLPAGTAALLGWPSVLLGVVPLVAPGPVARWAGLPDRPPVRALLRGVGLRELVVAVVFLHRPTSRRLWGFVGQDAVDLPLCLAWLHAGAGARTAGEERRTRRLCGLYLAMAVVDVGAALRHDR